MKAIHKEYVLREQPPVPGRIKIPEKIILNETDVMRHKVVRNGGRLQCHSRIEIYPGPVQKIGCNVLVNDIRVKILLYPLKFAVNFPSPLRKLEQKVVVLPFGLNSRFFPAGNRQN